MLNFTKKKKIKQYLSKYLFLLTALLFLLFPFSPVRAVWDILNPIWYASKLAYGIVYVIGLFFVLILSFLQKVATWNHFIDVPTVIQGWVIVRDLSNMFFILVLLVIAFATILRVENYSARRLLPKLLLMALLINFSRTICGLIIDASQVVMLTFVAGFSGTGVNNFVDLLGLDNMVKIVSDSGSDPTKSVDLGTFSLFSGVIAAVFAALAATIVLIVLLAVLIFRVVMLWLYVILSPLAFLLSTFPAGARYASMWWQEFIKQVIIGPVLAFFLWLALATASNSSRQLTALGDANGFVSNIPTELFQASNFQLYLITLGLLIGGLITAQQLGGAAGRMAGRGMGSLNKAANLGKTGLQRATGYSFVRDTSKQYMAMRKSARDDRVRLATLKATETVGRVKEAVGTTVSKPARGIWGAVSGRHEAEEVQKNLRAIRPELLRIKKGETAKSIEEKKEFSHKGYTYKYEGNEWKKYDKDGNVESVKEQEVNKAYGEFLESKHQEQEKALQKLRKRQKLSSILSKLGLAAGGLGAGALAGGAGLPLFVGGAAGAAMSGIGLPQIAKSIREAGKTDLKLASNYWSEQVSKEREGLKKEDNEAVEKAMDDLSKSVAYRAAALMEAMERKILDLDTVKNRIAEVRQQTKGDKKIMAQLEALAEKKYPGATKVFAEDTPQNRLIRRERFEEGIYNLKNLDEGSLRIAAPEMVTGIKTPTFKRQFKDLSDRRKKFIKDLLKELKEHEDKEVAKAAKEKLARVDNIAIAYDGKTASKSKELQEYLRNLTLKDLQNLVTEGSDEEVRALINALEGQGKYLAENVQRAMKNKANKIAQTIKNELNIKDDSFNV